MRLIEALEETATGALRRMASAHGLVYDDGTTRAELIDRIAERLADANYLQAQLDGLSEPEQAVLLAARASGGEQRGFLLDRDHPGAADALVERGLLYRLFAAAGPRRGELFTVPDELLTLLPEPPAVEPPPTGEPAPAERRASDPAFNLFCIASALGRHTANLEDEVRAWSVEPGGWDWDARWKFLRHLGQSAGLLVHQADGALVPAPTLARLLDDPPALTERLWRTYLRDRSWADLLEAGFAEGAELAGGLVLLEALDWARFEQRLLHYVVRGPLYWLGIVGLSADGLQLTRRAAARALGRLSPEPCSWTGVAELMAPPRAELGTLLAAERYLVLHERGRPSRYHLGQSHVAAALGSGGSIGDCRRLLLKLTRGALPEPIDERLAVWDGRFGALGVRPAVLLEARSAAELDEAIADERVRPLVGPRLGATVVEVPAAQALELAAALRESGHLPRVDAALRLAAEPRRAYAGLVDEHVLEFLLVSLLAFQVAQPEQLAVLEGSLVLLERLERQFPPERLARLRAAASRLAGQLGSAPPPPRRGNTAGRPRARTRRRL
ncbi:MAG: hypothetical protein LC797_02445 [Chloroflexi bacterium]|nr:hypothetical protein [Chloroflexota bacterium]